MPDQHPELVQQAQAGQSQAFAQLYDLYFDKLYLFIYYRVQHREIAEDLTSQTWLKVLQHLKKFNQAKGKFSSWLYTVAINTVRDYYRARRPSDNLDDHPELAGPDQVAEQTGVKLELDRVAALLNHLPEEQRQIIILRLWQDLSYDQIAAIINKSEAAAKMMFSRALKILRNSLLILWLPIIFNL